VPAGEDYGYDWVGNRLHPPGDPNPMVYNDGDQLVRWPGMYRYSYDGAGNPVQVRNDSQTQVLKSYTYSPAGLLATATFGDKDGNTLTLSNTWDADSNRVSFDANGTEYELVYDTTAGIPAVLEESTSGSTAHYIREPGGSLIARLNATDGIRYCHFDELGSTRLLTNSNGDITDRYAYDAYGSLLSHDCCTGSVQQPYGYVGQLGYYTHWMEPDFGLLQLGVRFYDPEVGRFTSRDPAQDGLNYYGYVDGRPNSATDPSGMFWVELARTRCLCNALARAIELHFGHDKIAHCFFNCRASQCLWPIDPYLMPTILSIGENDLQDIGANYIGGVCGNLTGGLGLIFTGSCERCCRCSAGRLLPPRELRLDVWRAIWRRSRCGALERLGLVRRPRV
jgi:RHS repeat-associated protein